MWAAHSVHHSAEDLNLANSVRISPIESFIRPLLLLWAPLFGFPISVYTPMLVVALFRGLLGHTQIIDRHPHLDRLFATPSSHRVHHGRNPRYLDRNFGSTLMLWDHLFGTYQAEDETPVYGCTNQLRPGLPGLLEGGYRRETSGRERVVAADVLEAGATALVDEVPVLAR